MAQLLQAIVEFGPRLKRTPAARLDDVTEWMAGRTGLLASQVRMVLEEEHACILFHSCRGTAVILPGIGTFAPSVRRDGRLRIGYRAAPALNRSINAPRAYHGALVNARNVGLDDAAYRALWDAHHPDDPLEL